MDGSWDFKVDDINLCDHKSIKDDNDGRLI